MKRIGNSLGAIAEIIALLVFAGLLVMLMRNFAPGGPGASQPTAPLVQVQDTSAYPPPSGTPYPAPSFEPQNLSSPTPYPSWTPYPTNTARPGPTYTPLPLVQPPKDAAGMIYYVAKDEKGEKLLKAFEVDGKGKVKTEAKKIAGQLPEGVYYPSPDGKQIAIIVGTEGGSAGYLLDVKSGKLASLMNGLPFVAFFNWYPDSKQVLVSLLDYGLWLVDVDGGKTGIALDRPTLGRIVAAASSPDGQRIIYTHWNGSEKPACTYIVDSDGRGVVEILQTSYAPYNLTWSPDGSQIAFIGDGLMVMNPDGSSLRQLALLPLPHCYSLNTLWSPNSQKLTLPIISKKAEAFCQGWGLSNFIDTNIAIFDVRTGQHTILYAEPGTGNIDPSWSPDGKKMLFVSNRNGAPGLWVVNSDGSDPYPLTEDSQFVRYPIWHKP